MELLEQLAKYFNMETEMNGFLKGHLYTIEVKKGDFISHSGSYNRNVYFVEKGLMRSFYYENGKDITTNFYTEGKLVANIDTLFKNRPTHYNIEALENSEIVFCN